MSWLAWSAHEVGGPIRPGRISPPALGPMDVEIRVICCGVCHSDLHILDGDWGSPTFPFVPGHEVVGRIVAVGEGVDPTRLGTRVGVGWQCGSCGVCRPCLSGRRHLCPEQEETCVDRPGGFAERLRVHGDFAVPVPDALESADAAPLFCAGATVYGALRGQGVGPGARVAVVGLGGLGHLAVPIAVALGAEVAAVSSSPEKEGAARALGASDFLSMEDLLHRRCRDRFDLILQTAPVAIPVSRALRSVAPGGGLCFLASPGQTARVPISSLLDQQRRLCGSSIAPPAWIGELLTLCVTHGIRPRIERFPIGDVDQVIDRVRRNQVRFRAVLELPG